MLQRIRNYINKSEFVKNSLTLLTGTSAAQIIPLIIAPVLSRIYSPGDFGVLALYMSLASIVAVFATGRYELAIMLPKKDSDALNIFSLSVIILVFVSLLLFLVVILFNNEITLLTGNEKIHFWLYFLPFSVLCIGLYKILLYWNNRRNKFKKIAVSKVIATSSNAAVNLSVGFVKKGSYGLIFGWIFGQLSSVLYLLRNFFVNDRYNFKNVNKTKIIYFAKRYKKFPLFDSWSELLNVLSVQLPIILITIYFGEEITGHFSFAYRILILPFSLIAFSMGQAFFKRISELKNEGKTINDFTLNVFKKLLLISFIPLSITSVFGDYIFLFVFGSEWEIAGKYSLIISLWTFTIFLSSPLTNIFAVFERQRTNFIYNLLTFILRTALLVSVSLITKDHFLAILVYALSGFIFRLIYLIIIMILSKVDIIKVVKEILKFMIPIIVCLLVLRVFILNLSF